MDATATTMIPAEERSLAVLTHLSGLAGYVIPLGGVIVPIIILLVKSEDRIISCIARQALLLNVCIFLAFGACVLAALTILLIPVAIIVALGLFLAAVALPIVGAIRASSGEYYRYPVVGVNP